MPSAGYDITTQFRPWHTVRGIKHSQSHAGFHEPFDRKGDLPFAQDSLADCIHKGRIAFTTVQVCSCPDPHCGGLFSGFHYVVTFIEITDSSTVWYDVSVKIQF